MGEVEYVEEQRGEYTISTDRTRLDVHVVYNYLHYDAYWSLGIPRDVVTRSIEHSLCFGIYHDSHQVGFARVVTDYATFAYLGDVFVLPAHRGKGLSKWLLKVITQHPSLQGLRRFYLLTRDAHGLYERSGFRPISSPERHMEIVRPIAELYGDHGD